jgi:hypothetical protein
MDYCGKNQNRSSLSEPEEKVYALQMFPLTNDFQVCMHQLVGLKAGQLLTIVKNTLPY